MSTGLSQVHQLAKRQGVQAGDVKLHLLTRPRGQARVAGMHQGHGPLKVLRAERLQGRQQRFLRGDRSVSCLQDSGAAKVWIKSTAQSACSRSAIPGRATVQPSSGLGSSGCGIAIQAASLTAKQEACRGGRQSAMLRVEADLVLLGDRLAGSCSQGFGVHDAAV